MSNMPEHLNPEPPQFADEVVAEFTETEVIAGQPEQPTEAPIEPGEEPKSNKSRRKKIVALASVAGIVSAGALYIASTVPGGEDNQSTNPVEQEDDPTEDESTPLETETDNPQPATEENSDNNEVEIAVWPEEFQPKLMNATDPKELIDQLVHNYNCVYNSPVLDQQLDCIRYVVGDGASGTLSSSLRDVAYRAQEYRTEVDPDWVYKSESTILDASIPLDEPIDDSAQGIEFIVRFDEEDGTELYKRLQFQRSLAATITEYEDRVERDVDEEFVWLLRSERQVEPGTQLNIG